VAAIHSLAALFPALAIAFAQTPAPPPNPLPGAASNTVIRVDVNLVQVDAVVSDSGNRRVTNLQAADFVLLQDGKPRDITNFSYVSTKPADRGTAPGHLVSPAKPAKGDVPPPPPVLQPTEVRRTLALVVDDLGLAAENIPPVRSAIRAFVDSQMRPGDLVAIVRTGAGMGALQQFTTDKRLLYAALDRVKYGQSRVGLSSFTPLGSGGRRGDAAINHLREESLAVGTLGALRFVVNTMRGFPGRKSVVLFTENIRMIFQGTTDEMVAGAVQQLSDAASRASVVIHAIDPRGIPDYNLTAADDTSHVSSRRASRVPAQRQQEVIRTEEGMFVLAEETGGLFLHDLNDLSGALKKVAEDSDGYYLIGYHPDTGTFENRSGQPKFHKIELKVKRGGLHVRSREGFFAEPGSGNQPREHTREGELNRALQSPFAGAIHPRLTAVFSNLPGTGSYIDALVSFSPKDLTWSSEPDGSHKALVDVAAVTFDENGLALVTVDTTFHLRLNPEKYADALKRGMVYGLHVPVDRPGPYLVRAALRDPATEGAGSAEQYVEVPDVAGGHLAISGIVLRDAAARDQAKADPSQGPAPRPDVTGGAARRIFRRGTLLAYDYQVFNAVPGASRQPELEVQTRLFHDGEQVPAAGGASGRLSLGHELPPGEYVLQVIVTDKLAKSKFATVTQSMDFEIEP